MLLEVVPCLSWLSRDSDVLVVKGMDQSDGMGLLGTLSLCLRFVYKYHQVLLQKFLKLYQKYLAFSRINDSDLLTESVAQIKALEIASYCCNLSHSVVFPYIG